MEESQVHAYTAPSAAFSLAIGVVQERSDSKFRSHRLGMNAFMFTVNNFELKPT